MVRSSFWVVLFFFTLVSFGQANVAFSLIDKKIASIPNNLTISTDEIANYINANFKTEDDKIRAVFYWTASNISYDVANMYAINFNETSENKIKRSLQTRKGVCINYAEIFNDIANKVGVESIVIEGYTKQNGITDYVSHAWCGAKIENQWYVFDPTWGSGYVNNNKFIKKINNYYFKTDPNKIISSHIPFDYLWQFSSYPVTNQEFYEGKTQINKKKKVFDFKTEILKYETLSEIDKLSGSAERIEKNGVKNSMIFDRLSYKKSEIQYYKTNQVVTFYNEAIRELNTFVNFRNKQFKPYVSDDELLRMIISPKTRLLKCQEMISNLAVFDKSNLSNINTMSKDILDTTKKIEEQEEFVVKYLSKSKMVRKTMFSKVSWFGIPLN